MSLESNFWYFISLKIRPFFDVDMNGKKISGLPVSGYPTEDDEAATKKYHDDNPGGVSDHGELSGLGDDDHGQYLNTTRHDTTARHPVSVIKSSTGSATGSVNNGSTVNITQNRKSFFPQLTTELGGMLTRTYAIASDPNDYIGRHAFTNNTGSTRDYWIKWDYLSSSGPPVIWVIIDIEGHILHCWESSDAPDPDNPNASPIEVEDKDGNKITAIKIVIPSNYKTIKKAAKQVRKTFSQYLTNEYIINLKTNKLKKKLKKKEE